MERSFVWIGGWYENSLVTLNIWLRKDGKWARNERWELHFSSSEYESESDSINGTEDSDSDTEFDVGK